MATTTSGSRQRPSSGDADALTRLTEIFAEPIEGPQSQARVDIQAIVGFLTDAFIEELGTSEEYEIGLSEPEDREFSSRDFFVAGKPGDHGQALFEVLSRTWKSLLDPALKLELHDGVAVVERLIDRIQKDCEVTVQSVNNKPYRLSDGRLPVALVEGDIVSPPISKYPEAVVATLAHLETAIGKGFVLVKTYSELKPLGTAVAITNVKRSLAASSSHSLFYREALEMALRDFEREAELLTEEKRLQDSIGDEFGRSTTRVEESDRPDQLDDSEDICRTCGKGEKHKDRNLERTVLILSVIFDGLGINAKMPEQIDAARIITGYSGQTIKELMYKNGTNIKKSTDFPNAYKKDFEFVSDLFRRLERVDLARQAEAKE